MGESLTQQRRVGKKPRPNPSAGTKMTVPAEEAPANYVPAAAVHRAQRYPDLLGVKCCRRFGKSGVKTQAQPETPLDTAMTRVR